MNDISITFNKIPRELHVMNEDFILRGAISYHPPYSTTATGITILPTVIDHPLTNGSSLMMFNPHWNPSEKLLQ